ncbi:hypothetical protein [Pelobacter seleniigenes]|uniref:hypothetical protein n=1 Tax=Pelobacter seleniigenes TaxID=407188 RepID=UPI0004A6B792|nr:hypothetical protein [Pelobacter seleniigenes]
MGAYHQHVAVPCRCGGQAKIFGPSSFAPSSHWGIYCSKDNCEKMAVADSMEDAIDRWNEEQALEAYAL